jgi:hypothetical protein
MASSRSSNKPTSYKESQRVPSPRSTSRSPSLNRGAYLVIASAALVLFTALALIQSPLRAPHPFATVFDLAFWRYPIVVNEIKELPAIVLKGGSNSPDLNAVWVSAKGDHVWVGGDSGALFHSPDGGSTWEELLPEASAPSSPQVVSVSSSAWAFIPVVKASSTDGLQQSSQSSKLPAQQTNPSNQRSNQQSAGTSTSVGTSPSPVPPASPQKTEQSPVQTNQPNTPAGQGEGSKTPQTNPTYTPPGNPQETQVSKTANPGPGVPATTKAVPKQRPGLNEPPRHLPQQPPPGPATEPPCTLVGNNIYGLYFSTIDQGSVSFDANPSTRLWCVTNNGGKVWSQGATQGPDPALLRESASPSAIQETGYSVQVGPQGSITIANGLPPNKPVSHTSADLKAIQFRADGRQGFVVGASGTVLKTLDGGFNWFPVLQGFEGKNLPEKKPRKLPAPWYYLSWFAVAAIAWPALRRSPEPLLSSEESIANVGVSDRPLEPTDADPLGYKDLALSISRFIRNENTIAPITIAITGEWGTGKSSIMNLLRRDLETRGLRPIWFNAWHNQTEDDLFATILQNVRKQGVPNWWQYDYFAFRLRLLAIRWAQRRIPITLLMMAIAFLTGVEWQHRDGHSLDSLFNSFSNWDSFLGYLKLMSKDRLWILLVCVLLAIRHLYKGLKAFGVDPASLLSSRSGQTSLSDLEKQTALRQRFGEELSEVTRALGPSKRMVLFVDDLDRCLPDNIRVTLEAVNFMVTSGECFVVMGFARPAVEAGVGLSFEQIAAEMSVFSPANGASEDQVGKENRSRFAQQYLDKLINIEIPARPKSSAKVEDLVSEDSRSTKPEPGWSRVSRIAVNIVLPSLVSALFVCSMALTGLESGKPRSYPPNGIAQSNPKPQSPGSKVDVKPGDLNGMDTASPHSGSSLAPSLSARGETKNGALAYLWPLTGATLLLYGFWRALVKRDEGTVKDSPKFRVALKIWDFVIVLTHLTPRSTKRFMNKVRCLAMRLRAPEEVESRWSLLRPSFAEERVASHTSPSSDQLPEYTLVLLSSMYDISPQILQNDEFYKSAINGSLEPVSKAGVKISSLLESKFREAVEQHRAEFPATWPPSLEQRRMFLDMFADFTVRS